MYLFSILSILYLMRCLIQFNNCRLSIIKAIFDVLTCLIAQFMSFNLMVLHDSTWVNL
jgi:hypothetical protein